MRVCFYLEASGSAAECLLAPAEPSTRVATDYGFRNDSFLFNLLEQLSFDAFVSFINYLRA